MQHSVVEAGDDVGPMRRPSATMTPTETADAILADIADRTQRLEKTG